MLATTKFQHHASPVDVYRQAEWYKKARCVCNGSPTQKGAVTLGKTYAAALDQSGCRIFYALSALKNYVIYGADATNAYAEAPPPIAKLFVKIDQPFQEWYEEKHSKSIPPNYVLPVQHAIQGHPKSARLWSTHIHNIITKILHFKSCHHEPCLYKGNYNNKEVLFLRQVDDFALSSKSSTTINKVLLEIENHLKQPLKRLGLLQNFNGIEINQTRNFIKISCSSYIKKLL